MKTNRREIIITLLVRTAPAVLGMLCIFGTPGAGQAHDTKPNIVFIPMDNLGYGEVGVYGGGITRGAPTPRIDQLSAEALAI